jgi:hypothetical protein
MKAIDSCLKLKLSAIGSFTLRSIQSISNYLKKNKINQHLCNNRHFTNYGPKKSQEIICKMWVYWQNVGA